MARVTVEDCIVRVPNRFELVMLGAQRARDVGAGASLTLDRDNDKNPVVALREIAEGTITLADLREALIRDRQRVNQEDEADEEVVELMAGEEELFNQSTIGPVEDMADVDTDSAPGESPEQEISLESLEEPDPVDEADELTEDGLAEDALSGDEIDIATGVGGDDGVEDDDDRP